MNHNTFSPIVMRAKVTEQLLQSLPAEFTEEQFHKQVYKLRWGFKIPPMTWQVCCNYGFVVVVRTELTTYTEQEPIWIDVKGRKYTAKEMNLFSPCAIATLFDCPDFADRWISIYCLPYHDESVEHSCERNIFRFDEEKFKLYLEENA